MPRTQRSSVSWPAHPTGAHFQTMSGYVVVLGIHSHGGGVGIFGTQANPAMISDAVVEPLYQDYMEAKWHGNIQDGAASAHRWLA